MHHNSALVRAQTPIAWAGEKIVDCHHHFRNADASITHLDGCGVSNALALAGENQAEQIGAAMSKDPGRFVGWFARADITKPEAEALLTKVIRNGAKGFGEIKFRVEAAGPELRRMYALAAELNVPILIHFQEVPHTPTEGTFSTAGTPTPSGPTSAPATRTTSTSSGAVSRTSFSATTRISLAISQRTQAITLFPASRSSPRTF